MALLSLPEAAIKTGFSIELLERLTRSCPKAHETRLLASAKVNGELMFEEAELEAYKQYLREPWPLPPKGKRPNMPDFVKDDVRAECHHECAVCGSMDNGEVAHIEPSSTSLNNSPDNLILLCPRHHRKYDLGFAPDSNVDKQVVLAAKKMRRASRRRMLRYEGNVAKALRVLGNTVEQALANVKEASDELLQEAYKVEIKSLMSELPGLLQAANDAASGDRELTDIEAAIDGIAPTLVKAAEATSGPDATEEDFRDAAEEVAKATAALLGLDEVDCPHCEGSGLTGLVGDLCKFCGGSCFVTNAKAEDYEPDDIDEVECPRCEGSGTTGRVGDLCKFCGGSCFVTNAKAEDYEPDDIDEVECPRCEGSGTTGRVGDLCKFCGGSCFVTNAKADAYREHRR